MTKDPYDAVDPESARLIARWLRVQSARLGSSGKGFKQVANKIDPDKKSPFLRGFWNRKDWDETS